MRMQRLNKETGICFSDPKTREVVQNPTRYAVEDIHYGRWWILEDESLRLVTADFPFTVGYDSERRGAFGKVNTRLIVLAPSASELGRRQGIAASTAKRRLDELALALWHAGREMNARMP